MFVVVVIASVLTIMFWSTILYNQGFNVGVFFVFLLAASMISWLLIILIVESITENNEDSSGSGLVITFLSVLILIFGGSAASVAIQGNKGYEKLKAKAA